MKNLFFAALVAVVAVGSAYAQEYSTGPNGTGNKFSCNTSNNPTCRTMINSSTAYIYPTDQIIAISQAEQDRQYVQF